MDRLIELQRDFVNLRLGTFIHFNSATMQFHSGEIEDWEFDHENADKPRLYPFDERDWNPDQLDCRQWAQTAKQGGVRFAALTAKHHEGFALWPSAWTEHCVKNSPNRTDVVAAYLAAFREAGIVAGLYFSVLDLTAGLNRRTCTAAHKAMVKGQLTELMTNYGEIPFLILDGWNAPWGGPSYDMLSFAELDALVKGLQPNCLLMNIGWNRDISGTDILFFENGAGQEIGEDFAGPGALCQKLTRTWFWRDDDPTTKPATAEWARERMEQCFAKNAAFLLNLSPNPHGRIDANLADEFARFGKIAQFPAPLEAIPEGWMRRQ